MIPYISFHGRIGGGNTSRSFYDEGEPRGDTGFCRRRPACQKAALTTVNPRKSLGRETNNSVMICRSFVSALLIVLLPLLVRAQPAEPTAPPPPGAHEPGRAPAPAAHPESAQTAAHYVPGIEQFMNAIQSEHAKLWYAGEVANWPLAAYQLAEIKEIMSDLEDLFPTFKSMPFGQMLDAVITGPIAELEKALDAKDAKSFAAGCDKLTAACNACHQATGNGFLVMQRPARGGFPNQEFRSRH